MTAGSGISVVISAFRKREEVRENLDALARQTLAPDETILVDNHSGDGTAELVRERYPWVKLIETPHDRFGACATFNLGFRAARGELIAILDDDVVLPPDWLERMRDALRREPATTAIVTCKVVEPGMPDSYRNDPEVNRPRYLATFRGCSSLARREPLERAGWYDERFFIYGNERDLAARLLSAGHRIRMEPSIEAFHQTPFGMKMGARSLYFHVRNLWWYLFKHCSVADVLRFLWHLVTGPFRKQRAHEVEAVGAIGGWKNLKATPGGVWIAVKATLAGFAGLPYCLRQRRVCRAPDFKPPIG